MELDNLKKLYNAMNANGFAELELELEGEKLKMELDTRTFSIEKPTEAKVDSEENEKTRIEIRSDKVGVFSFSGQALEPGVEIKKGQVLGSVKGISFQDQIKCSVNGRISRVAVTEGEVVDYGRFLFSVEID